MMVKPLEDKLLGISEDISLAVVINFIPFQVYWILGQKPSTKYDLDKKWTAKSILIDIWMF